MLFERLPKIVKGESKEIMTGLVDNLFSAFRENILSDADWMSSETKVQALDKLEKITSNIAFPDWINEEDAVNEKYATLEVSESYVGTRRSGKEWQQREWWSLLNEPVDKGGQLILFSINIIFSKECGSPDRLLLTPSTPRPSTQ